MELKKINHNSRVTSNGGDSNRIVVRQDSYSFSFIFALGIMYIPMNEGLHLPEIEKAPFLGLSCYLIVIDISNGSL